MTDILSLGPLLYHWSPERTRDFYYQTADEMDVDLVFLGEVVCSKRQPLHQHYQQDILERLQRSGKQVIVSSLALITSEKERETMLASLNQSNDILMEINDLALLTHLSQRSFAVGPYVNVYNESTLKWLEEAGAQMVTLPFELPKQTLQLLASKATASLAVQVFGRMPLAISARCYHARAFHLHKSNCTFVCDKHPDGLDVLTMDHDPFLTVNGTQTQSHTHLTLLPELHALQSMGIRHFRLSPHTLDMVKMAALFRAVQRHTLEPEKALLEFETLMGSRHSSNGFYHAVPGNQHFSGLNAS